MFPRFLKKRFCSNSHYGKALMGLWEYETVESLKKALIWLMSEGLQDVE